MGYKRRRYTNFLRVARQNAGYQQKQVAKLLGYETASTVNDWENERKMPSAINLMKLCVLYDTTPQELYPEHYKQSFQDFTVQ